MTKYLALAWNWLVFSSADPEAVSLSVKAVLVLVVTYGTTIAGLAHVALPSDLLTQLIDAVVAFVQSVLMVIASLTAVAALARKIYRTIDGTNPVVNELE